MIDFKHKGAFTGLIRSIESAGHWIINKDGEWITSDDNAVQAIIDAYPIASAIAEKIPLIKEMARQKILAFVPDWKQSNLNARQNELNMLRFDRQWTNSERDEVTAMNAVWNRAKAIRNASNVHELAIAASVDFAELSAYDITLGWPE